MKKSILVKISLLLLSFLTIALAGCKNTSSLLPFVSELRCNVYEGESENYHLKGYYGYKEMPYLNDAKVSDCYYELTFILKGNVLENTTYSLEILDKNEIVEFEKAPNGTLKASYRIKNFSSESFLVNVISTSNKEQITLKTTLPEKTLDINSVLLSLEKKEETLINSYYIDSEFCAEIHARVLVKNEKPYWYIAFLNGKTLKAFLVDGISGEVLAIREVI